jgi:putative transcriptional regulator
LTGDPGDVLRAPLDKGSLLVALPSLLDPNFRQTVVLLCEAGEDGSMGLVVNRPTDLRLAEALPDQDILEGTDVPVFMGGPVQTDRILILNRGGSPVEGFLPILAEVALGGTLEALKEAATGLGITGEFRPYRGYAGWAPGQLEGEVEQGAWLVLPGDADVVFCRNPALLWQEVMGSAGGRFGIYRSMPGDLASN